MINQFTEPGLDRLLGLNRGLQWESEKLEDAIQLRLLVAGFKREELEIETVDGFLEIRANTTRRLPKWCGSTS